MKIAARLLLLVCAFLLVKELDALELKFYPGDRLYLNLSNERPQTHDVMAHLLVVKNDASETITIDELRYQLFAKDKLVQQVHVSPDRLVDATAEILGLEQQGLPMLAHAICPPEALGKNGKLVAKKQLLQGEALTSRNVFITIQGVPSRMRVEASGVDAAGKKVNAFTEIEIVQYKSPNNYRLPLEGDWYMQAVPNVTSHHRWMFQTEFGIDFLKVDERGSFFRTDGKKASDYFAFGQPVLAAADGIVVTAINDATQDWDAWLPREGESEEAFERRSMQYQMQLLKKNMYHAVAGNLVVIEHPNKEYSAYAHLKTGSVLVKPGDRVKQGQKIAQVGDTGDYYRPHLHFQISNHTDLLGSRSLPFEFSNLVTNKPELGHFARIKSSSKAKP